MNRAIIILIVTFFSSTVSSNCISMEKVGDGNKVIITNNCGGTARVQIFCSNGKASTRTIFACESDYFWRSVTCGQRNSVFNYNWSIARGENLICVNQNHR
ncbi:hypothetical protein [Zobellella aerophila]|uniref:hypothetical protein n=1 Tax=Zobellella aerophila TaxID=870480 RepID=UPI0031F18101